MEFNADDDLNLDFLEGEEDELTDVFSKPDSVIFLVDAHSFMFKNENIEVSNSQIVANAYMNFLKDKLLSSNSDRSAMIFYNTVS
jgi:hypothetical protein